MSVGGELPGVDAERSNRVKANVWKDDCRCEVAKKNRKNERMTVRLLNMHGLTKQKWSEWKEMVQLSPPEINIDRITETQ